MEPMGLEPDFGRALGYRTLPIAVQLKVHRALQARRIRNFDLADVQRVEAWLVDLLDEPLGLPT